MPRMQILTPAEATAFETPPVFSPIEREKFFQFSDSLHSWLTTLRTATNQVGLVLTVGYFRATKRFFPPTAFHEADVAYVARQLGCLPGLLDFTRYDEKATASRHRRLTLEHLGFRAFNQEARRDLVQEIRTMVRSQMRPKAIFLRALELLELRKTEIPTERALTDLIAAEIKHHKQRLTATLETHLSPAQRTLLDALLDKPEQTDSAPSQVQRFQLTLLKRFSQSTKPTKIKANIADLRTLRPLYQELESVITALDLSPDGIRYYANAVLKARIGQVSRRTDDDRHLHLVCFIAHQFLRLHDVLVDIVLISVQHVLNVCQREHKERYYAARSEHRKALQTLVADVDEGTVRPLADIEAIAFCSQLSDAEKVQRIQTVLAEGKPQRTAVEAHLTQLHGQSANEDADYYAVLTAKSVRLQNRVADIARELAFQGDEQTPVLTALQYYQQHGGSIGQTAPLDFLDAQEQRLVKDEAGKIRVSLYKALLFIQLVDAIKAGAVNLKHSYKYRSLEDYLIPKAAWTAHRDAYLQRADLVSVTDCQQTVRQLAELSQRVHVAHVGYNKRQAAAVFNALDIIQVRDIDASRGRKISVHVRSAKTGNHSHQRPLC